MKIAIVTNIPTPYRNPVYSIVDKQDSIESLVFFCSRSEPNRKWQNLNIQFNHKFLSNKTDRFIHYNWNIYKELSKFKPDVIITSGFNPTMLLAWLWSLLNGKRHIPFLDSNLESESKLGYLHKLTRKIVFRTSSAFIGASNKTLDLYRSYNVKETALFKSCLTIDNKMFEKKQDIKRKFDLLFCGQFIEGKNPIFFCKLAIRLKEKIPNINLLLIGDGPLKEKCISELKNNDVSFTDAGFVQHTSLPKLYQTSKILIFPTSKDAWGLVANEALASGVPVLVSKVAGVAEELVIDNYNGYVFTELNLEKWHKKALCVLTDNELREQFSNNAKESVQAYSFKAAAEGILKAIYFSKK